MAEAAATTEGTTATTTTATTTATTAAAAKPWYDGKADAETIGYWQNKAWKADDPVTIALEATKAAREAQKFVGAPPELLIRLPKDAKDEAGWNAVHQRLGKPTDPKGYDFSDVKFADGSAIKDSLADTIRKTAFENHLSKDAAAAFARGLVKHMDAEDLAEATDAKTKWDAGVERIKQSWGANFNANQLQAMEGARKLGITQELYDTMAKAAGPDVVAELFRKIGAGISEDKLVEGNRNTPSTVEAAKARKAELMTDKEWMARYRKSDTAAVREMRNLNQIITGVIDTAAA